MCVCKELQVGAEALTQSILPVEAPSDIQSISDIAPSEPVLGHPVQRIHPHIAYMSPMKSSVLLDCVLFDVHIM